MITIPTIETERLLLRGWHKQDFESWAALVADAEAMHFVGGVQSRVDAWRSMTSIIGHWALRGYGFWAVERKSDGAFIGRIGIWYPEGWPGVEAGWTLGRPYWGQSFATEAAKASLDYGFQTLGVSKLISLIDPENHRSRRVAERLGETRGAPTSITIAGQTHTLDVWEISRERWLQMQDAARQSRESVV